MKMPEGDIYETQLDHGPAENILRTVFLNGDMTHLDTLDAIRARAEL